MTAPPTPSTATTNLTYFELQARLGGATASARTSCRRLASAEPPPRLARLVAGSPRRSHRLGSHYHLIRLKSSPESRRRRRRIATMVASATPTSAPPAAMTDETRAG